MIGTKTMMIGVAAAALVTTSGTATALAASPTTPAPVMTAFSAPLDNDHHGGWDHRGGGDWDHHRDWDGRRDHDGGWSGHPWRWWHDWGISADTCRDGGGHVIWDQHRCAGGRFDDFHIR